MDKKSPLVALMKPDKEIVYTLPLEKGDHALILAPHPDDETLGCGGAIIKMLLADINVTVALLTNGNGGGRIRNMWPIRKEEFSKAQSILGYTSLYVLDFLDGKLRDFQEQLQSEIQKILCEINPKLVLVPYLLDYSPDHQTANFALAQVLQTVKNQDIQIGMYEIWTPLAYPNCSLNITNEYYKKSVAMDCYQSQENYFGIIEKAEVLSILRAKLSMRKKVRYMECFKLFEIQAYIDTVETWMNCQN